MSAGQLPGLARNRLSPAQTRRWFHRPVLVPATLLRAECCPGARARRVCASSVQSPREARTGSAPVLRRVVHTPRPLTRLLLRRSDTRGRPAGHPGSRRGGTLLDRFGDAAMQRPAFARKQFCVHRLSCERVTERELVRGLFPHQLGCHQFFHAHQHVGLIDMHDLLEDGKIEASSSYGRQG